jgi:predicted metal-dependent hydrolase
MNNLAKLVKQCFGDALPYIPDVEVDPALRVFGKIKVTGTDCRILVSKDTYSNPELLEAVVLHECCHWAVLLTYNDSSHGTRFQKWMRRVTRSLASREQGTRTVGRT